MNLLSLQQKGRLVGGRRVCEGGAVDLVQGLGRCLGAVEGFVLCSVDWDIGLFTGCQVDAFKEGPQPNQLAVFIHETRLA